MRRSRSKLNSLSSGSYAPQHGGNGMGMPVGANRQTDEIQRRLGGLGVHPQQAMPEMYAPQPQHMNSYQPYPPQMYPDHGPQGAMQPQFMQPQPYMDPYQAPPAPIYAHPEPDPAIDHIRASIDQLSARLAGLQPPADNRAQSEALIRQNQQITAELLEMRKLLSKPVTSDNSDVRAEIEAMRQAVEANYNAISSQLASGSSSGVSTDDFAMVMEASHEKLAKDLNGMRSVIDGINGNSDILSRTLEARHDEVANRIAGLQETLQAAHANPEFYSQAVERSHGELLSRFDDLKQSVEAVEAASANPIAPDLAPVEMRLEEITRAVVALSAGNQSTDSLDRIEARIGDLAKTFTQLDLGTENELLSRIDGRIDKLTQSVSQIKPSDDNAILGHIDTRISDLSKTIAQNQSGSGDKLLGQIDARISDLTTTVSQFHPGKDDEKLGRIEAELADLKVQLAKPVNVSLDKSSLEEQMRGVRETLGDLSQTVNKAQNIPAPGFAGIADQISQLSEKLENRFVASSNESSQQTSPELLSRLDEMVSQVAELKQAPVDVSSISDMIANGPTRSLDKKVDRIAEKLEMLSSNEKDPDGSVDQTPRFNALETQLSEIMSHLGERQPASAGLSLDPLNQRLSGIEDKIGANQTERFNALETQLSEIMSHLGERQPVSDGLSLDPVTERLSGIEDQISASRDIAIEVASQAAEEAVQKTIQNMPATATAGAAEIDAIHSLTQDIHRWHDAIATSNSENVETFDAVKGTLSILAERLSNVEETIRTGQTYQFGPTGETGVPHDFATAKPITHDDPAPKPNAVDVLGSVFERGNQPEHTEHTEQAAEQPVHEAHEELAHEQTAGGQEEHVAPDSREYEQIAEAEAEAEVMQAQAPQRAQEDSVMEEASANNPLFQAAIDEANRNRSDDHPVEAVEAVSEVASEEAPLPVVDNPAMDIEELPETEDYPVEPNMDAEDAPLEPGSGAPDLAALVKKANERRKNNAKKGVVPSGSDFLASARRAAQAAAQEASIAQEEMAQERKKLAERSKPSIFADKKKVLMAGGAGVLVIALGVALAGNLFGGSVFEAPKPAAVSQTDPEKQEAFKSALGITDDVVTDAESNIGSDGAAVTTDQSTEVTEVELGSDSLTVNSTMPLNEAEERSLSSLQEELKEKVQPKAFEYDASKLAFINQDLKTALSNDDPMAMYEVALRYAEGKGVEKNLTQAAIWYERAAERGLAPAQYIIGNFNEKAIGIERNLNKAVSWYSLAAENGNVIAMHNLGVLHATPNAISDEPDMATAFKWFSQAAEYGVRDSQVNLGIFYARGMGTEADLVSAYKWFTIASSSGDKDAKSKLEFVKETLRPEQLVSAKAISESWAPEKVIAQANEVTTPDAWKNEVAEKPVAEVSKKTIAQMQTVLTRLGYKPGTADGVMGAKTRDAISKYQKAAGLKVTGSVNAELLRSLSKAISG